MLMRLMRLTLPLYILCLAAGASIYPRWGETPLAIWFGNVAQILALVMAGYNLTATGNAFGRKDAPRMAWFRLSIGIWIWVLAQCLETYCELVLRQVSYGTIADVFWLIGYIPLLSGISLLALNYKSTGLPMGSKQSYVFQSAILLALFAAVFFREILPQVEDPDRSVVYKFLDVVYPAFDFVLICVGTVLARVAWQMRGSKLARAWILICVGFFLTGVADVLLSYSTDLNTLTYRILDVIYLSAYFMIAFSAKTQYEMLAAD